MKPVKAESTQSDAKLDILLDLISRINSTLDLDHVLSGVIEGAKTITNSEACTVFLMDEDTGEMILTLPTGPLKESLSGKRIPANEGIAGWVVTHGKAQIVNNTSTDRRFRGDFKPEAFKTRNMICVPLRNQTGEIIGVLQAINKKDETDFTEGAIPFFQALANQAAIAIDNARLNEDRKKLLSEIHHRVKNNMALISGLMQIQSFSEENPGVQSKLLDNVVRISTLATVHEFFYSSSSFTSLQFSDTIRAVVQNAIQTLEPEADIATSFDCDPVILNINQAIPSSLLISEALIHIIKNGFEDHENGTIHTHLVEKQEENSILIEIRDDGKSVLKQLKPDISIASEISLIDTFSGQIDAYWNYEESENGNVFTIIFQKTEKTGGANHSLR
jgi:two-component sensor histidine kinase